MNHVEINKGIHLSPHFTLGELTKTSYHTLDGNIPSHVAIENLKRLCIWLEDLRYSYNLLYGDNSSPESGEVRRGLNEGLAIRHFPKRLILPWLILIAAVWGVIYWLLITFTNSNVPVADSFTTALSIVGIWALAHKYLEQWFIWIAVDVVTSILYFYKDIPFKASLYALYVIIAVMGWFKWKRMMKQPEK